MLTHFVNLFIGGVWLLHEFVMPIVIGTHLIRIDAIDGLICREMLPSQ